MKKLSDIFSTNKQVIYADFRNVNYQVHNGQIAMYRDGNKIWQIDQIFQIGPDGNAEDFYKDSKWPAAYDQANDEYCVRWPMEIQGVKGDVFFDPKTF